MFKMQYCQKCFQDISNMGSDHLGLFMFLCESYVHEGIPFEITTIGLDYETSSIILDLEANGYVITTESEFDFLKIKPIGVMCKQIYPQFPHSSSKEGILCKICPKKGYHL